MTSYLFLRHICSAGYMEDKDSEFSEMNEAEKHCPKEAWPQLNLLKNHQE